MALAKRQGAKSYRCQAQVTLARALLRGRGSDGADDVRATLDRARELAEDMGARPFEAQIHEVSAELAALRGDDANRERELHEAHGLYTEMGATGHAERVAGELGFAK